MQNAQSEPKRERESEMKEALMELETMQCRLGEVAERIMRRVNTIHAEPEYPPIKDPGKPTASEQPPTGILYEGFRPQMRLISEHIAFLEDVATRLGKII